jgi:2-amino-4-hydroxy-6-hydroxymethyldihydropteridine diphosphokinase
MGETFLPREMGEVCCDLMIGYLALGANLGNRRASLAAAVKALSRVEGIKVKGQSRVYETVPEAHAAQPLYLNSVVRVETALDARRLLEACLGIERDLGRVRPAGGGKAPRIIDIDVLLLGDQIVDEPGLVVPHPALLSRPFVRIPLADVASPGLRHPQSGEALDTCTPDPDVRPWEG